MFTSYLRTAAFKTRQRWYCRRTKLGHVALRWRSNAGGICCGILVQCYGGWHFACCSVGCPTASTSDLGSKSSMLIASTISEVLEISFMNYMTHCLTGMSDEAPGAMATAVLKESVQEMNYTRHSVLSFCLDRILRLGLNSHYFSCTPCNILTPSLVTRTRWIKPCFFLNLLQLPS